MVRRLRASCSPAPSPERLLPLDVDRTQKRALLAPGQASPRRGVAGMRPLPSPAVGGRDAPAAPRRARRKQACPGARAHLATVLIVAGDMWSPMSPCSEGKARQSIRSVRRHPGNGPRLRSEVRAHAVDTLRHPGFGPARHTEALRDSRRPTSQLK
eukprot:scaffold51_cov401-Prasinococcus_capsulatus_cf.AAC.40